MVGVKTWEDGQIRFILTCKAEGMKVSDIILHCKQRWPRKIIKDTGIRYVMTNYGSNPEYENLVPVSFYTSEFGANRLAIVDINLRVRTQTGPNRD